MQRVVQRIVESARVQIAVLCVIGLASILVGLETFHELASEHEALFSRLDTLLLVIFTLELAIRIAAHWPRPMAFFRDPWNAFDFLTVAIFYTPFVGSEAALLRLARVVRMFRLLRAVPGMQRVVLALVHSLPSLGYIGLLLFMLIYVYAVAGSFLFGRTDPEQFGNVAVAMRTLLQVVTFDEWGMIWKAQQDQMFATLYFVTFILVGTMVVLNLFIGVIMEGFEHARIHTTDQDGLVATADGRREGAEVELARISEQLESLKSEVDRLLMAARQAARK